MTPEGFTLAVESGSDGPVVRVRGELDMATAPQLDECLAALNGHRVTLDLSELTFMDSGGIAVIVKAFKRAAKKNTIVGFRGVQPNQRRLFDITGLADVLDLDDGPAP